MTLFDTSVLVQAMVQTAGHHARSKAWLDRAVRGDLEWAVGAHTLAELYAVLTALPLTPKLRPAEVRRLIAENVERSATIVPLTAREYGQVLSDVAERGLPGGVVYDALICRAAEKVGAKRLLTFNVEHFQRVWPDGARVIQAP